jgi:acylphosphatase
MARAVDVRITGVVQGVSFRAYAAREAVRLELAGWIRNDDDGSVLASFEGPAGAVAEMLEWCRRGPPAAQVAHVEVTDTKPRGATSFEVDY